LSASIGDTEIRTKDLFSSFDPSQWKRCNGYYLKILRGEGDEVKHPAAKMPVFRFGVP
jgi:hypothetical protein